MYGVYECPTSLTEIPAVTCRQFLAKTAKMIFQRNLSTNYFDGTASPPNAIDDADSWTGLADAGDGTTIAITPYLEEVSFGEQADIDSGENVDGAPIAVSSGTTPVLGMIRSTTPAEQAALAALKVEENLMVYFLDANGVFLCRQTATDIHAGFPISIHTFRMKGPTRAGTKADQFMSTIQFQLKTEWFETGAIVVPETGFNPLELAAT